uniref:Uncharacterized protein n=1 Tax=Lepeophtheirus salmonis TaxID=72036 RepID=A0A0K2VC40_LEPSM
MQDILGFHTRLSTELSKKWVERPL